MRKRLLVVFAFSLTFSILASAQLFGGLKAQIEKELAANPFLKKEGIRLTVVSEENGYVTLQMDAGNGKTRERIHDGIDIMSFDGESSNECKAIALLRKTITQIQGMDGVKQVLLTAAVNTALDKAYDAYNKKDYQEAAKQFLEAAEVGDPDAQWIMGSLYAEGKGVTQDDAKAIEWFRKAADQGDADAQKSLGAMYAKGRGVAQDDNKAVEWYRKAADQGNADAQSCLGHMYATGRGVAQDDAKAVEWYRKAADQGEVYAQMNFGHMYATGRGVAQDDAKAVEWFRKAADQGNAIAQSNLGDMYATGQGVALDNTKAVEWYRKAADQGRFTAQYRLGFMYFRGRGVPDDDSKMVEWFNKALQTAAKSVESAGWWDLSALAWFYATCPDGHYLQPKKAVEYALKAKSVAKSTLPNELWWLDTVAAAAHARKGDFDAARQAQQSAIGFLKQAKMGEAERQRLLTYAERRLALYTEGKPYTDDVGTFE